MNENGGKSSTILLTVIGIATLLVVVVGATFAYFAAQVTGNDNKTSISVQAAGKGTTIKFEGGETEALASNIYPRETAWLTKKIKLTSTAVSGSTATATYTFTLNVISNNFDDGLKYTFTASKTTGVNAGFTQVESHTTLGTGSKTIATGVVPLSNAADIEYTLEVFYDNDTQNNQNTGSEKKAEFNVQYGWANNQVTQS